MGNSSLLEIGPLEMQVIGTLSAGGELSVADIQSTLKSSGHDLAYTTVMTVLVRLHGKKLVSRRKDGRQFLYSAAEKKDSTPFSIFARVKNSLFGTDKLKPILGLLEAEEDLSREDLEALKSAVEARLKKRGRG
jgi:predicted transcriptional regulator